MFSSATTRALLSEFCAEACIRLIHGSKCLVVDGDLLCWERINNFVLNIVKGEATEIHVQELATSSSHGSTWTGKMLRAGACDKTVLGRGRHTVAARPRIVSVNWRKDVVPVPVIGENNALEVKLFDRWAVRVDQVAELGSVHDSVTNLEVS
ncbi:hypothetical protein HG530_013487 [Fusarium avenaceum]|nr:hypothetical protein HG530_013487 [Fusarium avenaceum]